MEIQLKHDGERKHPYQHNFECVLIDDLWINPGTLAITADGKRYVNDHIDWMFRQFIKDRRSIA